jgi:hypothetical protein
MRGSGRRRRGSVAAAGDDESYNNNVWSSSSWFCSQACNPKQECMMMTWIGRRVVAIALLLLALQTIHVLASDAGKSHY